MAKEQWDKIYNVLETDVSAVTFDVWLKNLEPISYIDSKLVMCANNIMSKNVICENHLSEILDAAKKVNADITEIVIIDPSERDLYIQKEDNYDISDEEPPKRIEAMVINPKYNFGNFVVGKSNQFVYAAAQAVAEEPGIRYNPLFIYGASGLGKTHIMHAIGNHVKANHPHLKVLYASCEKFMNEFIESIRTTKGKSTNFREKYRNIDVLMIDDIHFIGGKQGTQEEMFHTFNELYQANKQLILTSDRPPKEIPELEDRLRSRFEWGMIADVQPPDLETRIAILQKKAQQQKHNIPTDILTFMAESMSSNIRDMESLLNKVIFLSRLYQKEPTMETVREALKDYCDRTEESVTADAVIEKTCSYFNISKEDLIGKKKTREIVEPRQICIYLITDLLALPLATIGNIFGGRDHTTIMHARDKVANSLNSNIKIKVAVSDIKEMVLKR